MRRRDRVFYAWCLAAAIVLVGAYSNSFHNSFHFDDSHVVEGNLYIRSLSHLGQYFTDGTTSSSYPPNQMYRPLMTTSLAIDYWLGGGLYPPQFHLTQLTLLVILGVLLYFFFLSLFDRAAPHAWNRYAALAAATIFSVHTTNTETMNIIAVRAEILSAIGVVGAFLVYMDLPGSRRAHLYLLPMIAGAFAKSPAVIFAPLFLVYLLVFEQRVSATDIVLWRAWPKVRAAVLQSAPAFIVGIVAFLLMERMNGPGATYAGGDRLLYAQTQAFIWLHYVRLFFLPIGLTADTDWTLIPQWYDTRVIAGAALIAGLLFVLWRASERPRCQPVAFGLSWFVLALLPGSSILPFAEVTNEHRMFFPYIGFTAAVVWGGVLIVDGWRAGSAEAKRRRLAFLGAAAIVFIAGNAIGTYVRNRAWQDEFVLWQDVSEKSPGNGRGLMNYGVALMGRGRFDEARTMFERAQKFLPNYTRIETNLGIIIGRTSPAEADPHFARSLALAPNDPVPHVFYANWLMEQKRIPEAVPLLERAVRLSAGDISARHSLMMAYAGSGRAEDARRLAAETLALAPDDAQARLFLNSDTAQAGPK